MLLSFSIGYVNVCTWMAHRHPHRHDHCSSIELCVHHVETCYGCEKLMLCEHAYVRHDPETHPEPTYCKDCILVKLRTTLARWWLTYAPQPVWTVTTFVGDQIARVAYLMGRRTPCGRVGYTRGAQQDTSMIVWCTDYKGHPGRHTWMDETR